MSITLTVVPCRWCGKNVVPKIIDGSPRYPKKCPSKSCRRSTWNKSDQQIKEGKLKSIQALLDYHKDGHVHVRRSYKSVSLEFLNRSKRQPRKQVVCRTCELLFQDEKGLERHKKRRNHSWVVHVILWILSESEPMESSTKTRHDSSSQDALSMTSLCSGMEVTVHYELFFLW